MFQQGIYWRCKRKLRPPLTRASSLLRLVLLELVRGDCRPIRKKRAKRTIFFLRKCLDSPYDPEPNKRATAMLEQSLQLDPG